MGQELLKLINATYTPLVRSNMLTRYLHPWEDFAHELPRQDLEAETAEEVDDHQKDDREPGQMRVVHGRSLEVKGVEADPQEANRRDRVREKRDFPLTESLQEHHIGCSAEQEQNLSDYLETGTPCTEICGNLSKFKVKLL